MKEMFTSEIFAVIIGAVLTMITSLVINQKKVINELDAEIAKEKIEAYKNIYSIVCRLNDGLSPYGEITIPKNCSYGCTQIDDHKIRREFCFPAIFLTFRNLQMYKAKFSALLNSKRIFINQQLVDKLVFMDSYLGEICHMTHDKDDKYLHMIGFVLFDEIDEMRESIEQDIQNFFNSSKKQKLSHMFNKSQKYEVDNYKKTILYKTFSKSKKIEKFGDFSFCSTCEFMEKCPLNLSTNEMDKTESDVV